MPRGGKQPGAGRPKGSKGKATLERELQARLERERVALLEKIASGAPEEVAAVKAQAAGKRLMKDSAFDIQAVLASMAAYYQPQPTIVAGKVVNLDANPNANEEKFKEYAMMAAQLAVGAAKYQSPSFSAMVVGASVVTKVEISGGLPDDYAPPVPPGQIIDLKPGMEGVISAEDEAPPELPKVVNE